jgi:hypothetical protein
MEAAFYVVGRVPEGKGPRLLDEKLIRKYGISEPL